MQTDADRLLDFAAPGRASFVTSTAEARRNPLGSLMSIVAPYSAAATQTTTPAEIRDAIGRNCRVAEQFKEMRAGKGSGSLSSVVEVGEQFYTDAADHRIY